MARTASLCVDRSGPPTRSLVPRWRSMVKRFRDRVLTKSRCELQRSPARRNAGGKMHKCPLLVHPPCLLRALLRASIYGDDRSVEVADHQAPCLVVVPDVPEHRRSRPLPEDCARPPRPGRSAAPCEFETQGDQPARQRPPTSPRAERPQPRRGCGRRDVPVPEPAVSVDLADLCVLALARQSRARPQIKSRNAAMARCSGVSTLCLMTVSSAVNGRGVSLVWG